MKKRFHVKKRTLLLIAGIVWLIAGFNVVPSHLYLELIALPARS